MELHSSHTSIPGVPKRTKNLGATSKFYTSEEYHEVNSILRIQKY